jgi:hypothetical protein
VLTVDDTSPGVDVSFPDTRYGEYCLVVNSDVPVEVTFTVHRTLSPTFVALTSMFGALFIGIYAAWVIFATTVRNKYTKGAVYR